MLDANYLDAIKQFEGYAAEARWDYAQNTNGYGTRARYAGEVIDKAEADRRFAEEIKKAADFVESFAPGLDDGSKAALTSLTYNAGTAWSRSGLGEAVASGDMEKAQSIFLQYNKAGGSVLDGLVQRRLQEVAWFGQGVPEGMSAFASVQQSEADIRSAAGAAGFPGPRVEHAQRLAAAAGPLLPLAESERTFGSSLAASGVTGLGQAGPRAFAGLGGDPALLSLLSHLTKSDLLKHTGAEPRKSDSQNRVT